MAAYTFVDVLDAFDDRARLAISEHTHGPLPDYMRRSDAVPMLDNGYMYLADVRLTCYRNDVHWAVLFEQLGCHNRSVGHECIQNWIQGVGTCARKNGGGALDDCWHFQNPTSDGPDAPTFLEFEEVNPMARSVRIRNKVVEIPKIAAELAKAEGTTQIYGQHLIRSLVPVHRQELLATDDELASLLTEQLPMILRLNDWNHPDICGGQWPSGNETFRLLAEVLVAGDASKYKPTLASNTHWSHWPMGGSI